MKYFTLLSLTTSAVILTSYSVLATIFRPTPRLAAFSADSRHYIYLESSKDTIAEIPKAQMQIIDLASNSCIEKGCLQTEFTKDQSILPVKAAEDDLLKKTQYLRQQLKLNYLKTGIRLPIVSRKNLDKGLDRIIVPLNTKGDYLQLFLQQRYIPSVVNGGNADIDRAAMRLVAFYKNRRLTTGSLYDLKEGVLQYAIREVFMSPDRRKIVVLLDMTKPRWDGVLQTTLVHSFPLEVETKKNVKQRILNRM